MPATYPTLQTQLLSTIKVHSLPTSSFMTVTQQFCRVPLATNSRGQLFFQLGSTSIHQRRLCVEYIAGGLHGRPESVVLSLPHPIGWKLHRWLVSVWIQGWLGSVTLVATGEEEAASESIPLASATRNTMLVFQNRYFSVLLSPNSHASSAVLPFLRERRKANVSVGKEGDDMQVPWPHQGRWVSRVM